MLQKDIKLLWGRSGNRCSKCRCELSEDKNSSGAAFTLGEQAHIVGENEGSARWSDSLTIEERNSYHNLILLCPTHHTEIDKNHEDWPVEKIFYLKSSHELWVRETLADSADLKLAANQIVATSIIDSAVKLCDLENWKNWTSYALAPDPSWPEELPENLFEFRQKVAAAIWPEKFDELKRATTTLAILLHNASKLFMKHSMSSGHRYIPYKFYKGSGFNPNYDTDLEAYQAWLDECWHLIRTAARAANWFADIVRRDVNPMFFAERGKFIILEGPFLNLEYRASILEFTESEKTLTPSELIEIYKFQSEQTEE